MTKKLKDDEVIKIDFPKIAGETKVHRKLVHAVAIPAGGYQDITKFAGIKADVVGDDVKIHWNAGQRTS